MKTVSKKNLSSFHKNWCRELTQKETGVVAGSNHKCICITMEENIFAMGLPLPTLDWSGNTDSSDDCRKKCCLGGNSKPWSWAWDNSPLVKCLNSFI